MGIFSHKKSTAGASLRRAWARGLTLLLCGLLLCFACSAREAVDLSLVNRAGRQRMLSQRLLKSYLQMGIAANTPLARRQMDSARDEFEASLRTLQTAPATTELSAAIAAVDEQWRELRVLLDAPPRKDEARGLFAAGDALLARCERVVALMTVDGGPGQVVDVAGRQRMLSQRIAALYMLCAWNVCDEQMSAASAQARREFVSALATLRDAPETSGVIAEQLAAVDRQWLWLESALSLSQDAYYPLIVNDASEKILLLMENIVALYAGAPPPGAQ